MNENPTAPRITIAELGAEIREVRETMQRLQSEVRLLTSLLQAEVVSRHPLSAEDFAPEKLVPTVQEQGSLVQEVLTLLEKRA
jgi:uncharacterized coiled-coil protein SlyX